MKSIRFFFYILFIVLIWGCNPPPPKKKNLAVKHNYIILLDLSDRLIVQNEQPDRDKQIIRHIYSLFEKKVKKELYLRSRDEIRVVIAPQTGSGIDQEYFEDQLYVNMESIQNVYRRPKEEERKVNFDKALDELYKKAQFSNVPGEYYGADIWRYVYEDLKGEYSSDTLARNFLFILTDGYPIVGKDLTKLKPVDKEFPDLEIILLEASPKDKDMEWDHVQELWTTWFESMNIKDYHFIKRKSIKKIREDIEDIVTEKEEKK